MLAVSATTKTQLKVFLITFHTSGKLSFLGVIIVYHHVFSSIVYPVGRQVIDRGANFFIVYSFIGTSAGVGYSPSPHGRRNPHGRA